VCRWPKNKEKEILRELKKALIDEYQSIRAIFYVADIFYSR
jgi:hypothetical protein